MNSHTTSIRLDPVLYKKALKGADEIGLNFSNIVHLLLHAFVEKKVEIGVSQYSSKYVKALEKDIEEMRKKSHFRKRKRYSSSKALFDDILDR